MRSTSGQATGIVRRSGNTLSLSDTLGVTPLASVDQFMLCGADSGLSVLHHANTPVICHEETDLRACGWSRGYARQL